MPTGGDVADKGNVMSDGLLGGVLGEDGHGSDTEGVIR
jgi:hypothetical protein